MTRRRQLDAAPMRVPARSRVATCLQVLNTGVQLTVLVLSVTEACRDLLERRKRALGDAQDADRERIETIARIGDTASRLRSFSEQLDLVNGSDQRGRVEDRVHGASPSSAPSTPKGRAAGTGVGDVPAASCPWCAEGCCS